MICTEAAEFVSALCDGEIIPSAAAQHIGACAVCQSLLRDYLDLGAELRRTASLEQPAPVPARAWTHPGNPLSAFLQKGRGTMHIPRLAFAAMIAGMVILASTLAVVKVGAHPTGTVVLLTIAGQNGPLADCPLSTLDTKPACDWYGNIGSQHLAYRVRLLSRAGGRIQIVIRTRTYSSGENLSSFTQDTDPATKVKEVWFEPGQPLKVVMPGVGALTLTGEWMDHMPILTGSRGEDISPGPNELRFGSPLLLKDKVVVGDLAGVIGGIYSTDTLDRASAFYIPGQGRFLISLLPMKGAVEARVAFGRISFVDGGHSWELVNGIPVCRADHIWVLHQPDFKRNASGGDGDHVGFGNPKLVQTASGEWVMADGAVN